MTTTAANDLLARPWDARPYPGRPPVPTMLSRDEIDYLHWLAHEYRHEQIVELGCFLGGSTHAMASAMADDSPKLLTYDAFETPEGLPYTIPHEAGESFRPYFESRLGPLRERVTIREGSIPENPTDAGALYSERAPVSVLFIDCAKRWGVHTTILKAFGPHLIPGRSIVVQQDFKTTQVWTPLHMLQLRDCFTPVHDVPGWTLGFRYEGGIGGRLESLWSPDDFPVSELDAVWNEIDDWLASLGSAQLALCLRMARARHLAHVGRCDDALDVVDELYLRTDRALGREGEEGYRDAWVRYWPDGVAGIIKKVRVHTDALEDRVADVRKRPTPGGRAERDAGERGLRGALWRRVAERCAAEGWKRVALYGAGAHTRELLATGWPGASVELVAIIDDAPSVRDIAGVPVVAPNDAPRVDCVVPCSLEHEDVLVEAAKRSLAGVPIVRVYT